MDEQSVRTFPPSLVVGNRVWTEDGYPNHGPAEGPKVDISPHQGGTITDIGEAHHIITGYILFSVRWDNGQVSRHYRNELLCIGRFQNRAAFEAAVKPKGAVELTVGPGDGFKNVRFDVEYDGQAQTATLQDERLWREIVKPLVEESRLKISMTKLKMVRRKPTK